MERLVTNQTSAGGLPALSASRTLRKEGQMKYKIVIELETDRKLTSDELNYLEGSLELQIFEPQDFNGEQLDWVANSFEIGMNLND